VHTLPETQIATLEEGFKTFATRNPNYLVWTDGERKVSAGGGETRLMEEIHRAVKNS
jgi:hypothetical protein